MTIEKFISGLSAAVRAFRSPQKQNVCGHWYLFRSPKVADICAHLTVEEDAKFRQMGQNDGFLFGLIICVPMVVLLFSASYHSSWAVPVLVSIQIITAALMLCAIRKRHIDFMASTQYARSLGLAREDIPYYDLSA